MDGSSKFEYWVFATEPYSERKKEMSDFFITLPSNTKVEGNKTSDYRCPLAHPVDIDGQWQVGLAGIQYPSTWENVFSGEWLEFNLRSTELKMVRITIPRGKYETIEVLINKINELLDEYWDAEIEKNGDVEEIDNLSIARNCIRFMYMSQMNKVKVRIAAYYGNHLSFSRNMQVMLGFEEYVITTTGGGVHDVVAKDHPKFVSMLSSMYVYTNIIESQFVGDVKVPLLKIVPVHQNVQNVVDIEYPNIHYVNVLCKHFSSIEISIKGDTGELFPFTDGKVIVKLHFRKKKLL
ncbi:MAG: hypothetical protein GY820_37735 [Gammaproteobacteria bacterium]|nr:hypothetical protein [Gammaproteobacteria bacterium]